MRITGRVVLALALDLSYHSPAEVDLLLAREVSGAMTLARRTL